jgi:hypothetical protein
VMVLNIAKIRIKNDTTVMISNLPSRHKLHGQIENKRNIKNMKRVGKRVSCLATERGDPNLPYLEISQYALTTLKQIDLGRALSYHLLPPSEFDHRIPSVHRDLGAIVPPWHFVSLPTPSVVIIILSSENTASTGA